MMREVMLNRLLSDPEGNGMSSVSVRVIWLVALFLVCDCPAASSVPPLSELLEKYTQALDSTQSMISYYETSSVSSAYLPPLNLNYKNEKFYGRGQRRTDGQDRIYHQAYHWGYVVGKGPDVPEEKARYSLIIMTPRLQYSHGKTTRGRAPDGLVLYQTYPTVGCATFMDESDAFFLGHLGTDSRIDINLKNARTISVRSQPESINGSVCYVIEADTAYGDYTVWLDSAHGYQPARIESSRGADDIVNITANQPPPEKKIEARDAVVIDDVTFKKVQGVWVPVAGRMKRHIEWPKHRFYTKDDAHFKVTEILLKPDHDALESFADPMKDPTLDPELVNGTAVRLGPERLRCVWRHEKTFDGSGNVVDIQKMGRRTP